MTSPAKSFNIAVVGGGIAGVTLTIGLVKHSIPVTLYESAHAFGEIGAGVAFGPSAARAMILIDPEVKAGFDRRATFNQSPELRQTWFQFRRGVGHGAHGETGSEGKDKDAGQAELFCTLPIPEGSASVHRAHFLEEMVKLIPEGVANFGKRLEEIENLPDGKVKLRFKDGSEAIHDAVVGCDGIKSRTRQIVLGESDPAAKAVFSGKYAYRGLVPMDKAAELLGDELARNSQMYLGYHGHVLTFPIEKGATMNVVAFYSKESWDDPNWVVKTTKEELERDFDGWSEHVRSIISLMQKTDIWALFNHLPARTYTRDRICLIGDAAHATTPHQGSGAGMAVEDAYVLSSLLGEVTDPSQIHAAFTAFEKVRIERTHKLVTTSYDAGLLYDFEHPGIGDDVQKIAENLNARMHWIWDEDVLQEFERAKEIWKREIQTD